MTLSLVPKNHVHCMDQIPLRDTSSKLQPVKQTDPVPNTAALPVVAVRRSFRRFEQRHDGADTPRRGVARPTERNRTINFNDTDPSECLGGTHNPHTCNSVSSVFV